MLPFSADPDKPTPVVSYFTLPQRVIKNVALLTGALFLITCAALFYIVAQQNHRQIEHSKVDVAKAMQNLQDKVGNVLKDYAFWGDAYIFTQSSINLDWAYNRDNIGESLYTQYNLEGVFIVTPDLKTRYALIDGKISQADAATWLTGDLTRLIALAQEKAATDDYASDYFLINGNPAIVSAAVIRPDNSYTDYAHLSVLIYAFILDNEKLKALDEDFDLHNLRLDLSAGKSLKEPFITLSSSGGTPFHLRWDAEYPGNHLLKTILPLLLALAILFCLIFNRLKTRLYLAAKKLDTIQASLTLSEERLRHVIEGSSDWIWETNARQELIYLSDRFICMTGYTAGEWLGKPFHQLVDYDLDAFEKGAFDPVSSPGIRKPLPCRLKNRIGLTRHCSLSVRAILSGRSVIGYRGTVCDITEEVEAKAHIEYMSLHDGLTGLANRNHMHNFLQASLGGMPGAQRIAVLSLDLDRFKPINDTLGHAAGDRVLNEIAGRLKQCIRQCDLVARMGGDEFIILAIDPGNQQNTEKLCRRIIDAINTTIFIGEHELSVGVSIGIARCPENGTLANDLLRYSDIALYEAKSAGRNNWKFYVNEMNERILERRQVETDLRQALRRNEFFLEFQPRFELNAMRVAGAEALIRWNHPVKGLQNPAHFISVAEETGLIVPISDWVMLTACREATGWDEDVFISVNLSPVEFYCGDLIARVSNVLQETGICPARVELEITESVMMEDADQALVIMRGLKALGIRLSMDDFGTGYSSLSYLRLYPFDGLKIDRSFIANLDDSQSSQAIIQSVVGLGRAMSLTVTAEGVETSAQLDELLRVNCHQAQGFLLGRPMSVAALKALMKTPLHQP
ncbi:PAS domain S-box protein [Chimaeribacter arupi]|uniref:EAL domain-containing protein n=1 Tax=Nissabacter archeti TaxID=1917880 RepID=A0ABS5JFE2_9GAMM|nr:MULTISPECIES: EAL domain-containing protein [Yersiniaceae]MBS0968672.1 EAL domain-containing protein [Nissabacter archeti]MDV5139707.1 EAL domain-containing protein [Chimaeribacter arupi]PLR46699.1 PAS domain S-box protein [Chimaeribacter arupi]PLR52883.1 PAS domain S-box protein [Chimaeribacter arupi]